MSNYELKQTIILECEIDLLRDKIKKLKQEVADLKSKYENNRDTPFIAGKIKASNLLACLPERTHTDSLRNDITNSYDKREMEIWDKAVNGKTDLWEWALKHKDKLTNRVYKVMTNRNTFDSTACVEDITWEEFNKYRGLGKKAWENFVKLRGY